MLRVTEFHFSPTDWESKAPHIKEKQIFGYDYPLQAISEQPDKTVFVKLFYVSK